jgi:hypothetical protein
LWARRLAVGNPNCRPNCRPSDTVPRIVKGLPRNLAADSRSPASTAERISVLLTTFPSTRTGATLVSSKESSFDNSLSKETEPDRLTPKVNASPTQIWRTARSAPTSSSINVRGGVFENSLVNSMIKAASTPLDSTSLILCWVEVKRRGAFSGRKIFIGCG